MNIDTMTLEKLVELKEQIDPAIEAKRLEKRSQLREAITRECAANGFKLKDVLGNGKAKRMGAGVAKFRDPKTLKTWTGHGRRPGWLKGSPEKYAIG